MRVSCIDKVRWIHVVRKVGDRKQSNLHILILLSLRGKRRKKPLTDRKLGEKERKNAA
jgi:hypothetical protein